MVVLSTEEEPPRGRLFAALVPPPEVVLALDDAIAAWDVPGRRVPPENWHVTLRFVGRLDEVRWDRWRSELDRADLGGPLRVRLGGPGAFPRPGRATVVFARVEARGLAELAATVEEATVAAGIEPEERPFHPHLTLARVRPPADVTRLTDETEGAGIPWRADRLHLMAGVGSRYRSFESFRLGDTG